MALKPGDGFEAHVGNIGASGTGQNALSYLVVIALLTTLGFLAWTNWTAFSRIEQTLKVLSNDIRCLAWAASDERTRARLPICHGQREEYP